MGSMKRTQKSSVRLGFANFSAPNLLRVKHTKFLNEFLGAMLNVDSSENLALIISPAYSANVGEAYLHENAINKNLAEANINTDRKWTLLFNKSKDPRDLRPLLYQGRICLPMRGQLKNSKWRTSGIISDCGMVGPCPLMKTIDMTVPSDTSECALPPSTHEDTHLSQPVKVMQIGHEACNNILHATLDSLKVSDSAISIADLTPYTGDMVKAFLLFQAQATCPMHLHAYASNDMELAWLNENVKAWAREKFLDGTLKIKGVAPLPEEVPREMLEADIPLPQLHVMTWNQSVKIDGVPTLTLSEALVKKYLDHPDEDICSAFKKLWEDGGAKHFVNVTSDTTGDTPVKRKFGPTFGLQEPESAKKLKVEDNKDDACQLIESMNMESPTCEATLPGSGDVCMKLIIGSGNKLYLGTASETESSLLPGAVIAGYWKGKWWHNKDSQAPTNADISYELNSTNDLIFIGSTLQTVGDAIRKRTKSNPGHARDITYHDMVESPSDEDPMHQTLTVKHAMVWKIEEGAPVKKEQDKVATMDYRHVAGVVDPSLWNTAFTKVIWSAKWSCKGLCPVRPNVVVIKTVKVKPGMVLPLLPL